MDHDTSGHKYTTPLSVSHMKTMHGWLHRDETVCSQGKKILKMLQDRL